MFGHKTEANAATGLQQGAAGAAASRILIISLSTPASVIIGVIPAVISTTRAAVKQFAECIGRY